MSVAIIKYNAGNLFSVKCALARIGVDAVVSDFPWSWRGFNCNGVFT